METGLSLNHRELLAQPAKLRPAVAEPLELYTPERIAEFAEAEQALSAVFAQRGLPPLASHDESIPQADSSAYKTLFF